VDDLSSVFGSYERFLTGKHSNRILSICTNSEFFKRQKVDLLSRVILDKEETKATSRVSKYICIGAVKTDLNTNSNSDNQDCILNYEMRKKYFEYAAKQRQMISNDLNQSNVNNLTLFSIVFDLFSANHQNDVSKFKLAGFYKVEALSEQNQAECSNDEDEFDDNNLKMCEQSSFILYNCARLNAIIEKFQTLVKKGK
jgi:hypothetical protein